MVVFDTREDGFRTVVNDYLEIVFLYLWRLDGGGASSRDFRMNVNKDLLGKRILS